MAMYVPTTDTPDPRRLVLRALDRQPQEGFTPERLAGSMGLPVSTVIAALAELTSTGLVRVDDGEYLSTLQLD